VRHGHGPRAPHPAAQQQTPCVQSPTAVAELWRLHMSMTQLLLQGQLQRQ
jgi:hypothetical protein